MNQRFNIITRCEVKSSLPRLHRTEYTVTYSHAEDIMWPDWHVSEQCIYSNDYRAAGLFRERTFQEFRKSVAVRILYKVWLIRNTIREVFICEVRYNQQFEKKFTGEINPLHGSTITAYMHNL